jgi:hypothetical protein
MKTKSNKRPSVGPTIPTLANILPALAAHKTLSISRQRDLCSSVKRVAFLHGDDPARIPLDLRAISAKLATVSPVAAGLTQKSFANIRSNFLAAVKASGLRPSKGSSEAA